jgi:predicted XRE-type DNA-binding protein
MQEIFKPVPYKPFNTKYVISNLGNVKPIIKSKYANNKNEFLKWGIGSRGYPCVTLYCNGKTSQLFVHRMVALAFIGDSPTGKKLVCHKDDDKLNNTPENLSWGDNTDNMRDMAKKRRSMYGERNCKAKLTEKQVKEIKVLLSDPNISQTEIAGMYGVCQTQISHIKRGTHWGYLFS